MEISDENPKRKSLLGAIGKGLLVGLGIAAVVGIGLAIAPMGMWWAGGALALKAMGILAINTATVGAITTTTASMGAGGVLALGAWGAGIGAALGAAGNLISKAFGKKTEPIEIQLPSEQERAPLTPLRSQGMEQTQEMDNNPYYQPGRGAELAQIGDAKPASRTPT